MTSFSSLADYRVHIYLDRIKLLNPTYTGKYCWAFKLKKLSGKELEFSIYLHSTTAADGNRETFNWFFSFSLPLFLQPSITHGSITVSCGTRQVNQLHSQRGRCYYHDKNQPYRIQIPPSAWGNPLAGYIISLASCDGVMEFCSAMAINCWRLD